MKHAWIIAIHEKNTGLESGHNSKVIEEFQPSYSIFQHKKNSSETVDTAEQDPGIDTGHFLKNEYGRILGDSLRKELIYFYCNWKCANPWLKPFESRKAITKREFLVQLSNCRIKRPMMDPTRDNVGLLAPKLTWSGKIGSNGKIVNGQNDDLVISGAMALYWAKKIDEGDYPGFPYEMIYSNTSKHHANPNRRNRERYY